MCYERNRAKTQRTPNNTRIHTKASRRLPWNRPIQLLQDGTRQEKTHKTLNATKTLHTLPMHTRTHPLRNRGTHSSKMDWDRQEHRPQHNSTSEHNNEPPKNVKKNTEKENKTMNWIIMNPPQFYITIIYWYILGICSPLALWYVITRIKEMKQG